ncbi:MAG: SpoIIE family protein phosphatase [Candidatus Riflebacteria bacterium]|nr:SpoIIE family protein phosphatase [Candidatus Riflebacteria bacterium]
MSPVKARILLVDDDENFLASNARVLCHLWDVVTASSGEAGLQALDSDGPFAVVVSDFNMPRMNGTRFLTKVRDKAPDTVRMMLTGEGDFQIATQAVNEGYIFRFLTKPCPQAALVKALEAGLEQYRLIQSEKEARQQEVRIASEIQQSLLLEPPPVGIRGAQIVALTIPSCGADGDFIDFFDYSDSVFDAILGDVMGKGIPAALIGAGTKSKFSRILSRLFSTEYSGEESCKSRTIPSPKNIMRRMQQDMGGRLLELASFVTLFYARFDLKARLLTFVDAGHTPTLFVSNKDGAVHQLKGEGVPLGFPELGPYDEISLGFQAGDVFFIYSDGLMDGANAKGEPFGVARLEKCIAGYRKESAQNILQHLLEEFRSFVGSTSFSDDLSCIVVKIDPDA